MIYLNPSHQILHRAAYSGNRNYTFHLKLQHIWYPYQDIISTTSGSHKQNKQISLHMILYLLTGQESFVHSTEMVQLPVPLCVKNTCLLNITPCLATHTMRHYTIMCICCSISVTQWWKATTHHRISGLIGTVWILAENWVELGMRHLNCANLKVELCP